MTMTINLYNACSHSVSSVPKFCIIVSNVQTNDVLRQCLNESKDVGGSLILSGILSKCLVTKYTKCTFTISSQFYKQDDEMVMQEHTIQPNIPAQCHVDSDIQLQQRKLECSLSRPAGTVTVVGRHMFICEQLFILLYLKTFIRLVV